METTLSIALPKEVTEYVDARVADGSYGSVSEYICSLVEADQQSRARGKLEALLIEGLDSGPPIEATDEYWDNLLARYADDEAISAEA